METSECRLASPVSSGAYRRAANCCILSFALYYPVPHHTSPSHIPTKHLKLRWFCCSAVTRGGAVFAENASSLLLQGNNLLHIGGNGIFLSNSVANVSILDNRLSYLGTSGVSIVGRTGKSMMDARDGEAMLAAGGTDNGVRLPKHNLVSGNVISDYGVWDKQSAAFHKALGAYRPSDSLTSSLSRHTNFSSS